MGHVELVQLPQGFVAVYEGGADEVAAVRERIAARQAERAREAKDQARRTRRTALGRSNARRPGQRGGAA